MNERRMFGWDLPPGVTNAMIERAYGDEEPPQLHCDQCHGFLRVKPDRSEPWEDAIMCDGQHHEIQHEAEEIVAYEDGGTIAVPAHTEVFFGQYGDSGECPNHEHEPHKIVMYAGYNEIRSCGKCGAVNVENVG